MASDISETESRTGARLCHVVDEGQLSEKHVAADKQKYPSTKIIDTIIVMESNRETSEIVQFCLNSQDRKKETGL